MARPLVSSITNIRGDSNTACLEQVLEAAVTPVLATDPVALPLLQRWPGCGGTTPADGETALKLHVRFNVLNGALQGPFVHAGRTVDPTCDAALAPLSPGTLLLADLAYFNLGTFAALTAQWVSWLSRVQPGTHVYDAQRRVGSLADFLAQQTGDLRSNVCIGDIQLMAATGALLNDHAILNRVRGRAAPAVSGCHAMRGVLF